MSMFDFLKDVGNYEKRKVALFQTDNCVVSTAAVSDGVQPFETAVSHKLYTSGDWIIVAGYPTKESAQIGHDSWVRRMTAKKLPNVLEDCGNAEISQLFKEWIFERGIAND